VTKLADYWGYLDRVPEADRAETDAQIEAWIAMRSAVMDRHADVVASSDGVAATVLAHHSPYMGWWFAHRSLHFDYAPSCYGCNGAGCGCLTDWPCETVSLIQGAP
jgi:hypothetical protein